MGTRRLLVKILTEYDDKGTKQATNEVKGLGGAIKGNLGAIAGGAIVAAGAAIYQFGKTAVNTFQSFDQGMKEVFTLLPGISAEAMGKMSDQALQLAKDTGRLPEEILPALYQALSSGAVNQDNVFDFLKDASESARGGAATLTEAVDVLTGSISTYGSATLTAQQASDVLFTAVRLGKTTFSELTASLSNVLPAAQSLGVSFEDTLAAITVLTTKNVSTAQATTQLRQAFVEASKSGTGLSDAIKELTGNTFAELVQQGHSSTEIFQMLRESMPEQEFRDLFSSVEAANAVLLLTGDNAGQAADTLAAMGEATGATAEAAATMGDSMQYLEDRANASSQAMMIQIGEVLKPLKQGYLEAKLALTDFVAAEVAVAGAFHDGNLTYAETMKLQYQLAFTSMDAAEAMAELEKMTNEAADGLKDAGQTAKGAGEHISNYETQNRAAAAAAREAAQAAQEQANALTIDEDKLRAVNRVMLEFGGNLGPTTRELEEAAYASGDLGDYQEAMLEPIIRNQEALDLLAQQATATGDAFSSLTEGAGPMGIFNQSLSEIGEQMVTVGGRTADQNADLARLQEAYSKASQTLRDYELGIKGANLTDEERAEKIAEQQALMAGLSESMQPLLSVTGQLVSVTGELTVNQDALNSLIYSAADSAGANAGALALLKIATGELTEAQAEAIIKQIALDETLKTLAEGYAAGDLTLQQYMTSAQLAVQDINNMTVQFDTMTGSVETSSDSVNSLVGVLGEIPSDIPVHISITSDPIPTLPSGPDGFKPGQEQYRAAGGPVNAGQPYIVGERGEELFVPHTSGTIIPNGEFGAVYDQRQTVIYANSREAAALAMATVQQERRKQLDSYMGV